VRVEKEVLRAKEETAKDERGGPEIQRAHSSMHSAIQQEILRRWLQDVDALLEESVHPAVGEQTHGNGLGTEQDIDCAVAAFPQFRVFVRRTNSVAHGRVNKFHVFHLDPIDPVVPPRRRDPEKRMALT